MLLRSSVVIIAFFIPRKFIEKQLVLVYNENVLHTRAEVALHIQCPILSASTLIASP